MRKSSAGDPRGGPHAHFELDGDQIVGKELLVQDKQRLKALSREEGASSKPGSEAIEYLLSHMRIKEYSAPVGEIAPMQAIHEDDDKARKPFENYLSRTNRLSKLSLNATMFKKYRDYLKQHITRRSAAELSTAQPEESSQEY